MCYQYRYNVLINSPKVQSDQQKDLMNAWQDQHSICMRKQKIAQCKEPVIYARIY